MEEEQFALRALDLYPDKVKLVYHHYPSSEREYSSLLAELLEFAAQEGKFWQMHDKLAEYVPGNEDELTELIDSMDFDEDALKKAMENYTYRGVVQQAKAEAESGGVTHTGLFINGREYEGYPGTFEEFLVAIEAAIESVEGGD